ncbi:MAG: hypothetical protein JO111_17245 [Caulobacteraceae bacterium]|nr:hypothetical protein [Caulobacteraceae bacterium]
MSKPPPIPKEQQSHAAPGKDRPHVSGKGGQSNAQKRDANLSEVGRAGNIWQNTHNQGYQQDR